MQAVPITRLDCEEAWADAKKIGVLKNSLMGKSGSFVGIVGELAVFRSIAHLSPLRDNTFGHDLLVGSRRIDVKTKRWARRPPLGAPVNVPEYSRQDCDAYIFAHLVWRAGEGSPVEVLIAGWIERDRFIDNSTLWRRGETKDCGWVCSKDCREMPGSSLNPMESFGGWCGC
jgi:hypothetical protein